MELHPIKQMQTLRFQGGERVGCLTIIGPLGAKHFKRGVAVVYECQCDCGLVCERDRQSLIKTPQTSCGPLCRNNRGTSLPGSTAHPLWKRWHGMLDRCLNPRNKSFVDYGKRGIKVCDRWRFGDGDKPGFQCFAADMGECPPDLTLERDDSNADYAPDNCRWASRTVQSRNRRSLRLVEWGGKCLSVGEWAERTGIPYFTLMQRVKRGWTPERALTEPLRVY